VRPIQFLRGRACIRSKPFTSIASSAGRMVMLRAPLAAKAHAALLIGAAAAKIAEQLQGAVPLVAAGTIEAAIAHAYAHAVAGDTVLLAPACASFDQFQSYEHRGRFFKQIVHQLQMKN